MDQPGKCSGQRIWRGPMAISPAWCRSDKEPRLSRSKTFIEGSGMALFEFLELPQMQRAFAIAALAGPMGGLLGTFITLRGMSFFSDAVAHSAMTGVTLGFALNLAPGIDTVPMQLCVVGFCVAVALLMVWV